MDVLDDIVIPLCFVLLYSGLYEGFGYLSLLKYNCVLSDF